MSKRASYIVTVVGLSVVAALAGYLTAQWTNPSQQETAAAPTLEAATWLPDGGRSLPRFELTSAAGESFGPSDLKGQWDLLFFGYTHCPDVCPLTLQTLASVRERMTEEAPQAEPPRMIFVSVDPERDDPQRIQEYLQFFDPEFVGVTGPTEDLVPLTARLGILHAKQNNPQSDDPQDYLVDHSAGLILVGPAGRWRALFPAPHQVDAIAADLSRVVGSTRGG